ncbi:MAG: hypothetical protein HOO96_33705 [Polyangiaceae bacterium]|nr:hypothetical protein [Polyangiaceae bacterium]
MLKLAALIVSALLATGCTADAGDDSTPMGGSEDDLTLRAGYKSLRTARDQAVYTGIAVDGQSAYLASNDRTIDVVSLKTLKRTKTFSRIAAEALSFDGGKLVACGMRDDSPAGWPAPPSGGMANNYVVSFLDPSSGAVGKEIVLKLETYLGTSSSDGFVDLPNMSCKVSGGTITIGFAQEKLQHEIVSFEAPRADKSVFDFREIPGATRTKVGKARRDRTITGFAISAQNGLTLAAGGYGIDRVVGATTKELRKAEPREHFVDLWDGGGATLLAVDNDGALLTLDAKTGKTLETTEIPDWLEGVTVRDGFAFVAGRKGIFIKKLAR